MGFEEETEGPMMLVGSESQLDDMDQEQVSESGSSTFECEDQSQKSEGPHVKDQLVKLTENFKLGSI